LDKVLGFAQKLASLRVSNGGQRDGWDVGLDIAKEFAPPVIQLLNNFMILRSQAKGGMQPAAGMSGAVPATASFDPYRDQAALRNHARMMNQQAAAAAPAGAQPAGIPHPVGAPNPPSDGAQPQSEIAALLANYGSLVLAALNSGQSGAEFAGNVAALFGSATPALIGNHGEEVLTQGMLAVPELALS
jgi:hypothetical protein